MEPADSFSTRSPFDEYEVIPVETPPSRKVAPPKRKARHRGPEREYDTDGSITAAMEAVANRGLDDRQSGFINLVVLELQDRRMKIPGPTWLKEHAGGFYKRYKRRVKKRGR
jgi:hypothetical protein